MNTPAHVVLNALVLGRREEPPRLSPVVAGALMPDLPMVVFYIVERLVFGRPESYIWSEAYFAETWQAFIDTFNSLPILLVLLAVAVRLKSGWSVAFFSSMVLHCLADLPLHHDDGHRHFFPLSDWRFESPVSYWDPGHYGGVVSILEIGFVLAGSMVLARRHPTRGARLLTGGILAFYALHLAFVIVVWM